MNSMNLLLFWAVLNLFASVAIANVVLIGNNVNLSFDDIQANFGQFYLFCFYFIYIPFGCPENMGRGIIWI